MIRNILLSLAAVTLFASTVADPQMQTILDQLQALGPKPLETLTPVEARKPPTPAGAV